MRVLLQLSEARQSPDGVEVAKARSDVDFYPLVSQQASRNGEQYNVSLRHVEGTFTWLRGEKVDEKVFLVSPASHSASGNYLRKGGPVEG